MECDTCPHQGVAADYCAQDCTDADRECATVIKHRERRSGPLDSARGLIPHEQGPHLAYRQGGGPFRHATENGDH